MSETARRNYPAQRAAKNEVLDKVNAWLARQRQGYEFNYRDLADELGLNKGSTEAVLSRLAQEDFPVLERGYRRGVWRVTERLGVPAEPRRLAAVPADPPRRPAKPELKVGQLVEVILHTQDGEPVLRDDDGVAWKAVPL